MKQFHVGEVIRECRQHRDITQVQLCEGICDTVTMSRIESGKQQPRRAILILLLQRLGVAEEQYHGLCSFDDLALEELKLAIRNANARFDYRAALGLLGKLMVGHDCQSPIMEQFVLWTQAINGRLVDDEVAPYPLDEKLALLTRAIRCTVPSLDLGNIGSSLLGLDEIKIILSIANVYSNMDRNEKAVGIYPQLLAYIEKQCMDFSEKPTLVVLVTYNYSRALGMLNRFDDELKIVEIGIACSIESGISRRLGELLMNKSCALRELGRTEESKIFAIHTYYFMKAIARDSDAEISKKYLGDKYNWTPD